jgi:hypothetical protein
MYLGIKQLIALFGVLLISQGIFSQSLQQKMLEQLAPIR